MQKVTLFTDAPRDKREHTFEVSRDTSPEEFWDAVADEARKVFGRGVKYYVNKRQGGEYTS